MGTAIAPTAASASILRRHAAAEAMHALPAACALATPSAVLP
jgi:hypothetical protein